MPVVEFTDTFPVHRGAIYNKGDRAMLTDEEAGAALRQRCGILLQDPAGYEYDGQKALSAPPSHKQIKGAPVAK